MKTRTLIVVLGITVVAAATGYVAGVLRVGR
jgi:hypothetical protein